MRRVIALVIIALVIAIALISLCKEKVFQQPSETSGKYKSWMNDDWILPINIPVPEIIEWGE